MRLLRTAIEALEAEKAEFQCSGVPGPRRQQGMAASKPPAPKLCAFVGSQHSVDPTGSKCCRCFSSSSKATRTS
eukprot:6870454-Pyramimonas_sp.AAC.1